MEQNYESGGSDSGFTISPKMVSIAAVIVLAIVFVFQNTDKAKLKIIFFTVTMPLWIAFVVLLAIGAVIGYVLHGIRDRRNGN